MPTAEIPAPYPNPSNSVVWEVATNSSHIAGYTGEAQVRELWYTVWESSFWETFMGDGEDAIIQTKHELQRDRTGDIVHFYLIGEDTGAPIDNSYEAWGSEETSTIYQDSVTLGLIRHSKRIVKPMSQQRSIFDLTELIRKIHEQWWIDEGFDKMITRKLCGLSYYDAGGSTPSDIIGEAATANTNVMYGGDAVSENTIDSSDKLTLELLYKAREAAQMGVVGSTTARKIAPASVYGERNYIVVLHPYQIYDLTQDPDWRTTFLYGDVRGSANELIRDKGNLPGMKYTPFAKIEDMLIFSYRNMPTFTGGVSGQEPGAYGLFLGRQAGLFAFGGTGLQ
jgi:N4-gp56 family major capsid protein